MKKLLWGLGMAILAVCVLAPGALFASEITPYVNEVENHYANRDVLKAAEALRNALVVVYNHSNLKVEQAELVSGKPRGFGMIQRRKNNVYRPDETIVIYVEPVGYHIVTQGNTYSFGVTADFSVTDEKGNILGGKKGFGKWGFTTQGRPLFDFYLTLTYNFTGIKPGKYFILTTLTDKYGGGSVTIKTPIEIAP